MFFNNLRRLLTSIKIIMYKLAYFFAVSLVCCMSSFAQNSNACNCCTAQYQGFDFWLGEWEVTTNNGQIAGYNSIKKVQNNCVVQENWTSANPGYTGTSYNFFNARNNQWEQIWIDSSGQSLHLKGERTEKAMILKSDPVLNKDQKTTYNQITWTANSDGTVRQLWEVFTEGEEVKVAFDGLYRKKK